MMAQWQLDGLLSRLPAIATPTLLLAGSTDRTVPPSVSRDATARMPNANVVEIAGMGHLLHEEAAEAIAPLLMRFLKEWL
jgi:magnesium chelatase accessory protein